MKKIRKPVLIAASVFLAAALLLLAAAALFPLLQANTTENIDDLDWEFTAEGDNYYLTLRCKSFDRMIRAVHILPDAENHTMALEAEICGIPFFGLYQPKEQRIPIGNSTETHPPREITLNGFVLYQDGVVIHPYVAGLYALSTPYIGDVSQNQKILRRLWRVLDNNPLADITYEMKTSEPPYEWTVNVGYDQGYVSEEQKNTELKKDACVLLALIGNMDAVIWNTEVDGKADSLRFDTAEAQALLGKDVKTYGESAASLQSLMEQLQYVGPAETLYFNYLNEE